MPVMKDDFLTAIIDPQLTLLGYDTLGLVNSPINASLELGDYVAAHTYGWTEFEIDAATRELVVTTWGIAPYALTDLQNNPADVLARGPAVMNRFRVQPDLMSHSDGLTQRLCGLLDHGY